MRKKNKSILSQFSFSLFLGFSLVLFVKCSFTKTNKTNLLKNNNKEIELNDTDFQDTIKPSIQYSLISTNDSSQWLGSLSSGDTLEALLFLNRIDRGSLLQTDSLIYPDTFGFGIDLYSPFPQNVIELRNVHKILVISYYAQAFAVYENGIRIRWGPASLGKQSTPTPLGLFATNWKSKRTVSTIDPTWVMDWYFNIENSQGVSMHQYALPGYPASHACIRLYKEDAYWLYYWADQWVLKNGKISVYGTPVIIYGTYPFDKQKPWLQLAENNKILDISQSQLMNEINQFMPIILTRQAKRDSFELFKLASLSNIPAAN